MARANTATLDGIVVGYGARDTFNAEMAAVHTKGRLAQIEVEIDYRNIASFATSTAASSKDFEIPAGSVIRSANLVVSSSITDLTSLIVGTKVKDGTTFDDNGLIASTAASAIVAGSTVEGTGAQVNGAPTAAAYYVSIDVTGTAPTAGHGRLVIVYEQPLVSQAAPAVITGVI